MEKILKLPQRALYEKLFMLAFRFGGPFQAISPDGKEQMTMQGEKLFDLLVKLSGIEKSQAETELTEIMRDLKIDRTRMTTEDVRVLVAAYLERIHTCTTQDTELVLAPIASELEADDSDLLESHPVAKA
jgi:hypothetical protein